MAKLATQVRPLFCLATKPDKPSQQFSDLSLSAWLADGGNVTVKMAGELSCWHELFRGPLWQPCGGTG
jgi:hypothetical protein